MIIRIDNKTWQLPDRLPYNSEYSAKVKYRVIGYRKPKKGEYFISGSLPHLYKAANDLSFDYLVAELL